jgi:hypothetical protein
MLYFRHLTVLVRDFDLGTSWHSRRTLQIILASIIGSLTTLLLNTHDSALHHRILLNCHSENPGLYPP